MDENAISRAVCRSLLEIILYGGERGIMPLVLHVIYRLDVGGLENGLVNLVNYMPRDRFRHAIVCLTEATDFKKRIQRSDVGVIELHKRQGHDFRMYLDLYRLFREMRPAIVHSRNLAALEAQIPAFMAGVPVRIHGEHGWDVQDLDGLRYRRWKRILRLFVHHYIALSKDIERYLENEIGVSRAHLTRILNGVDTRRFRPTQGMEQLSDPYPVIFREGFCIGTVGRLEEVKNQALLLDAFERLCRDFPETGMARLVVVGDGSLRAALEEQARSAGVANRIWFAGARDDVAAIMRQLDLFVLPSRAEGISNTIMEAMASGVPVVATDVGGNGELVVPGETGDLVPPDDPVAMAEAIFAYLRDPGRGRRHGMAARKRAQQAFSLQAMVDNYMRVYERSLMARGIMAERTE